MKLLPEKIKNPTPLAELMALPGKDPARVLGDWLREGERVMMYAGAGVGKTYTTLILAHHLSSGSNVFGFEVPKARRILYFDGEMGKQPLASRMNRIEFSPCTVHPMGVQNFDVFSFEDCANERMWNLSDPKHQALFDRHIQSTGANVVILDNLNCLTRPVERYDTEVTIWDRVQDWLVPKKGQGITFLLIHHAGKSGSQLGTSKREGALDWVVQLRPSEIRQRQNSNAIEWVFDKRREGGKNEAPNLHIEIEYCFDDLNRGIVKYYHEDLDTLRRHEAHALKGRGYSNAMISEFLNIPSRFVTKLLEKPVYDDVLEQDEREDQEDLF